MGPKCANNTCLSIASGLGKILKKMLFFALGTLVDPLYAPTVRGPGCPPAPPSDPREMPKGKDTVATAHVALDYTMSKSPLVPSNPTIYPRNRPKGCQKAPKSAQ